MDSTAEHDGELLANVNAHGPMPRRFEPALTQWQRRVYDALCDWHERYGYTPSIAQLAASAGMNADRVLQALHGLARRGWVSCLSRRPASGGEPLGGWYPMIGAAAVPHMRDMVALMADVASLRTEPRSSAGEKLDAQSIRTRARTILKAIAKRAAQPGRRSPC